MARFFTKGESPNLAVHRRSKTASEKFGLRQTVFIRDFENSKDSNEQQSANTSKTSDRIQKKKIVRFATARQVAMKKKTILKQHGTAPPAGILKHTLSKYESLSGNRDQSRKNCAKTTSEMARVWKDTKKKVAKMPITDYEVPQEYFSDADTGRIEISSNGTPRIAVRNPIGLVRTSFALDDYQQRGSMNQPRENSSERVSLPNPAGQSNQSSSLKSDIEPIEQQGNFFGNFGSQFFKNVGGLINGWF